MDILEKKIRDGIMVNHFLPSYANRPNETNEVVKCKSFLCLFSDIARTIHIYIDLKQKFKDTVRHCSPEPRTCHIYTTSVTVGFSPYSMLRIPVDLYHLIGYEDNWCNAIIRCVLLCLWPKQPPESIQRLVVRDGILREYLKKADLL